MQPLSAVHGKEESPTNITTSKWSEMRKPMVLVKKKKKENEESLLCVYVMAEPFFLYTK
jgi:hypothetical protein